MLDSSIDSALLALRKQIMRGTGEGLEHVEAILRLRNVPLPRVLPARRADCAKSGQMRRMIFEALRAGGLSLREVSLLVAHRRPELTFAQALKRSSQCLDRMNTLGLVERRGRNWSLTKMPKG